MRRALGILVILGPLWMALWPAGCSDERKADRGTQRPNVLLIVLDTLRVDKLGCYGSELGASPRIDELAGRAVQFERAYSHAPWTVPACASILTSLYPPQHGAGGSWPQFRKLPDSVRTGPECFRDAGYDTAAVINVQFLTEAFGMTQGFDQVDAVVFQSNVQVRTADEVTDAALAWLAKPHGRPFFFFVHYFDPHLVYAPPPEYRKRFAEPQDRFNPTWVFGTREQVIAYRRGMVEFSEATIRRAERLYDGEVAFTDHEVGRLLDGLRDLGLTDSTVVALTADHGEEFLDHGGFEHGHTLFDELVRVPLILRVGTNAQPRKVSSAVGHVDLLPTLCELAHVEPGPDFVGRSLVDLIAGRDAEDHAILFEGNFWGEPLRGWLQGSYKLILSQNGTLNLFNVVQDPLEKQDLAGGEPDRIKRMVGELELIHERLPTHMRERDSSVDLTPEQERQLESIGYVGG